MLNHQDERNYRTQSRRPGNGGGHADARRPADFDMRDGRVRRTSTARTPEQLAELTAGQERMLRAEHAEDWTDEAEYYDEPDEREYRDSRGEDARSAYRMRTAAGAYGQPRTARGERTGAPDRVGASGRISASGRAGAANAFGAVNRAAASDKEAAARRSGIPGRAGSSGRVSATRLSGAPGRGGASGRGDAVNRLNPGNRPPASGQAERRRPAKRRRRILWLLPLILVLLFGFYYFIMPYFGPKYWTVAVFGLDSRDGSLEKGSRSDVNLICSINRHTGEIELVSVFRDTYLQVDAEKDSYNKINAAYERGGHRQAIQALERNLDIKIDDYVTFNWSAVAAAINALGGVDVELSDAEFYYINAFITETVESTGIPSVHLKQSGMNHLDGVQAVAYGRLRLMDTDFNRTARQRKIISLALDKARHANPATLARVAQAVLPQLSTSLNMGDLVSVISRVQRYHIGESSGFPFSRTTKNIGKLDCVIPTTLESNVVTLHQKLYGTQNYQPSRQVQEISAHVGEVSGFTKPGKDAPEAEVGGGVIGKKKGQKQTEAAEAVRETRAESNQVPESTEASSTEAVESDEHVQESTETAESRPLISDRPGQTDDEVLNESEVQDGPGEAIKQPQRESSKASMPSAPGESREEIGPGV